MKIASESFSFILRSLFECFTLNQQVQQEWKWKIRVYQRRLPSPVEDLIIGGGRRPRPADLSPVSLPILLLSCTSASKILAICPHSRWTVFLFPCTNFLSQIVACLPLCPYTIVCIVLCPPVCVSACLSARRISSTGCDTLSLAIAWGDLHLRITEMGL